MPEYKLTRQGVRDLGNTNPVRRRACSGKQHHFGPVVVVDVREAYDEDSTRSFSQKIYGRRCMWCGETRTIGAL